MPDIEYYSHLLNETANQARIRVEIARYGNLKERNPCKIKVIDPEDGFVYGNCAEVAITRAFRVDISLTREIFDLMGVDSYKGCTGRQCNKCIEALCRIKRRMCWYTSNRTHISSTTFYMKHKKGLFLLNFDGHLSVLRNGTVYDSFIGERGFKLSKLMGWWQIK